MAPEDEQDPKARSNTEGKNENGEVPVLQLPRREFTLKGQDAVEAQQAHDQLLQALQDLGRARLKVLRGQAPLILEVEAAAQASAIERECNTNLRNIANRYGADFEKENWTFQSKTLKFIRSDLISDST